MYYDPQLDVHHRLSIASGITTSFYTAPQMPDDARRLFSAACTSLHLDGELQLPLRATRGYPSALILAKEWEQHELAERLSEAFEACYQPMWDNDLGEFTWGLGLDEPHPRGQYNAFMAAAEAAGPGMWTRLSAAPLDPCPQVVDVDFPTLSLSRAEWVNGILHLRLAPLKPDPNVRTSFRIVGAEPRIWELSGIDGASMDVTSTSVIVRVPLVEADIEFIPSSY